MQLGLVASDCHTNSRGFVHGGLISTLADNAMGLSCAFQYPEPRPLLTVNLSVDYISVARLGQWLLFDTTYTKIGGSLCFAECFVRSDDKVVAKASGVFKA